MTKLRSRSRTTLRRPAKGASATAPLPARRPIFLVGFMGAGKTVVGKALAKKLGWRFLDLDDAIVEREGRPIAEIFRERGETAFRQIETEVLSEVVRQLRGGPAVIAVGGGAFVQQRNAVLLRRARVHVVFLDAPVEQLMLRCRAAAESARPLFHDENQFRQLYEQRRPRYMEADACINTASRTVDEVADQVKFAVGLHGGRESAGEV
jgi:shikimate kinase